MTTFSRFGFFTLAIVVASTPRFLSAAYLKGDHVISLAAGGSLASNELDQVEGTGPTVGLAYRYYLAEIFSLGGDVALDHYGRNVDEDEVDADARLFSASVLGRMDFLPGGDWACYASLGLGLQRLNTEYHEAQGDRTESTARLGYFMAAGLEMPVMQNWMGGIELRSTDPLGVSADTLALKLTFSRRFR